MTSATTSEMPVGSWNEWDPLEEVVVGSALGAVYPESGPILAAGGEPDWLVEVPECLSSWELLPAPEPTYAEDSPMAHPHFTSQWLSMNVLSLDPRHVLAGTQQKELIRRLKEWRFEPIPLAFDYVGLFGGSFHCATLDVRRRGSLESYC
jgi:hypothetical protein